MFAKLLETEESGGGDHENFIEAETNTDPVEFAHFFGYSSMA
jgi:hypothetical protein